MRYVHHEPTDAETIDAGTNLDFFRQAKKRLGDAAECAVLLVGGSDRRSLALRHAQAILRFDRRPSKWSHAALLLRWTSDSHAPAGLEVSLAPELPAKQVPERNGVTAFSLATYADRKLYPNVAVVGFAPTAGDRRSLVERVRKTASHPCSDLARYPLWDSLSSWASYVYAPETVRNPLLAGVAEPSAAFCEFAFAGAGIDLTPVATRNDIAPEHLWATAQRFAKGSDAVSFRAVALVRDEQATPAASLSTVIDLRPFR